MLTIGKRFLVKRKREKKMNRIKLYWSTISPNLYLGALGLLIFIGTGLVLSIPLWLLWNWLMPYIFGLPTLNIIQMFGLSILITLLSPKEIKFGNRDEENWDLIKEIIAYIESRDDFDDEEDWAENI